MASVDHRMPAQKCHVCRTPTLGVDRNGRPFCADCLVASRPKDPKHTNWSAAAFNPLTLEPDDADEPEEIL